MIVCFKRFYHVFYFQLTVFHAHIQESWMKWNFQYALTILEYTQNISASFKQLNQWLTNGRISICTRNLWNVLIFLPTYRPKPHSKKEKKKEKNILECLKPAFSHSFQSVSLVAEVYFFGVWWPWDCSKTSTNTHCVESVRCSWAIKSSGDTSCCVRLLNTSGTTAVKKCVVNSVRKSRLWTVVGSNWGRGLFSFDLLRITSLICILPSVSK